MFWAVTANALNYDDAPKLTTWWKKLCGIILIFLHLQVYLNFKFKLCFSEKGKTIVTKPFTFWKWKHISKKNHILKMKAHSTQNSKGLRSIDFGSSSCWKGEKLSKGSLLEKRKREREMFAFPKHSKVCVHCRVVIWHTHMWAFQMTDWLVMLGTAKQTYCSLV